MEIKPNPVKALLMSRKFLLMVLDVLVSTVTYFTTKYASPELSENIVWLIGSWQPVIITVIIAIAAEDVAAIRAQPAE